MQVMRSLLLSGVSLVTAALPVLSGAQAVVAVMDTGVTITPDIKNNIAPGGFNFVNNTANFADDSSNTHGTAVARSIVDVDKNTLILPVKTIDGDFNPNRTAIDAGYDYAASNSSVRIINHSNGSRNPATPARIINAAAAGKLIIVQAGNDSLPNPTGDARTVPALGGRGIIVGANSGNDVASFSNRAGNLKDFYVMAKPSNSFTSSVGTSMSTARVSGTAAAIMNQAPFLSPEQVAEIIFTTATDVGPEGVDEDTGWGILNHKAALAPAGNASASSGGGAGAGVAVAAVAVAGGIAYAVSRRNKKLKKTIVTDDYGRGYVVDLTERMHPVNDKPNLLSILNPGATDTRTETLVSNDKHHIVAVGSVSTPSARDGLTYDDPFGTRDDHDFDRRGQFSMVGHNADGSGFGIDLNAAPRYAFGALGLLPESQAGNEFLSSSAFSTPFIGFTDDGVATRMSRPAGNNIDLKFGYMSFEDDFRYGRESDAALFEATLDQDRYILNLHIGQLVEDGSLFGGSSGGAFSVSDTTTLSLGLSAAVRLTDRVSLIANYVEGVSDVKAARGYLLQDFSTVRSNAFGLGLVAESVWRRDDQFGVALSQPLRVTDGSADLYIPDRQDLRTGKVSTTRSRTSLVPEGAERAFETYYRFRIGPRIDLTSYFMYQHEPAHDSVADGAATVFATFRYRF